MSSQDSAVSWSPRLGRAFDTKFLEASTGIEPVYTDLQ